MELRIENITIGERIRKDFGDLQPLAESIADIGLLQPIGVTPENMLVFGERRLRAVRDLLHWDTIAVRVVDIESIVLGEHAENELRKDFTISERVAIGEQLERILGERRGRPSEEISKNFYELKGQRTDELAAEKAGFGNHVTYRQAKEIIDKGTSDLVRAMDAELIPVSRAASLLDASPEFQKAVVKKLESGEAARPMEAIRQVKAETIRKKEAVMPSGKYRVLYADPPWSYGNTMPDDFREQRDHYPVMSLEEICALPIESMAEDDAVLFLWVTSPILEESFEVVHAWGFQYKATFIWDKVKHNMGHYNSVRHEILLVCTRGSCQPDVRKLFDSVVTEERTEHSRKPEVFYDIIETTYPHGARVELFARRSRKGWQVYGNDISSAA